MSRVAPYFGTAHPLADAAARNCAKHVGPRVVGRGRVACGACWELAIRDDERLVVQCDLPREIEPDPDYVDEIAVDLACRGERVELTRLELHAAVDRLAAWGLPLTAIADRLHVSPDTIRALREPQDTAPSRGGSSAVRPALRAA